MKFFTRTGLTHPQLIIIFLLKVMAGILYGWIGIYYGNLAQMVDTWSFHYSSLQEYRLLHTDPYSYFTNLFHDPYPNGYLKFLSSDNSYWNDLKANAFVKLLSVFNIFSFGFYYVNIIFYSFLSLYGPVAVYRVMIAEFPERKIPVLAATFLLPSFIYWTSGIHKDGLIFTGIALVVYHLYFGLQEKSFTPKRLAAIFLGLLIVVILRNFLLVILIPAIIAWILAKRFQNRGLLVFVLVYVVFSLFFFTAKYISPRLDFPDAVASKQADFKELKGGSEVPTSRLQPNFLSFLKNAPEAITLSAIRPYPSDVKHLLSLAAALEINLLTLLFIVFLFWRNKAPVDRPFLYFCLFFSFSVLLSIGYTVNFLGAIVRYRSLVFPFLFAPMFALFNWKKIEKMVS
ncbi:MAG TPA: hypothetical protein VFS36_10540 [Chitinophagaceae bacterium]|nr:hypothetical protein [Chitinophagaceae bacterium]